MQICTAVTYNTPFKTKASSGILANREVKPLHLIKPYIYIIPVRQTVLSLLYMVNTYAKIGCVKKLLIRQKSEPKFNCKSPASFINLDFKVLQEKCYIFTFSKEFKLKHSIGNKLKNYKHSSYDIRLKAQKL